MTVSSPESASWGLLQWAATAVATAIASAAALLWRLMLRLETLGVAQTRLDADIEIGRASADAAMLRFAERLAQMNEDHYRLREAVGALPTREELRDLEDRLGEQFAGMSRRLDRVMSG